MTRTQILHHIGQGRSDLVFDLLDLPDWREAIDEGPITVIQWMVYYNDVTAMKAVLEAGGDLSSIDLDSELGNAAFFGHWKVCDFLIHHGANVNAVNADTGETALHSALAKAGRPYFLYVIRLLVEHGADVNAKTIPGKETGAFMRDVRTKGETPLHRAAAYSDADTIEYLLANGADPAARDAHGDSPMSWASVHLRPGHILTLLSFGNHQVGGRTHKQLTSDHGARVGQWYGVEIDWWVSSRKSPDNVVNRCLASQLLELSL